MTKHEKEMAIVSVELILKHGLPVFINMVRTLQSDEPTIEEIRALKDRVKDPESYFGAQVDQGTK